MALPIDPAEFLDLDVEQQADLLLAGLADCRENECGRNFLLFQLQAWYPEVGYALGTTAISMEGRPRRDGVEDALEDAYARLESRGLIRPNPRAGNTFCKLTAEGEAHLGVAQQPDAARIGFAHKALEAIDLHPALEKRQVGAHFRQGKFETALRDGSTFLEDSIRSISGLDSRLVGVNLVSKAFAPSGPLADPGMQPAEQTGLQQLYMGFFGAIRNVVSHKDFRYAEPKEAFQALMQLDYLSERLGTATGRLGKTLP